MDVQAKCVGGSFAHRKVIAAVLVALLGVMSTMTAHAGTIGTASGFEDDDGNLAFTTGGPMDWNGFAPTTWNDTAPYQDATKTVSPWTFVGLTDDQQSTTDTGFAGGVKQDKNCPTVGSTKAPNKDDLKRAYVATATVPVKGKDHIFLELAWMRITQNTTSPSAHVGFEFNQGATACGSGGLVSRVAGDMLVVYDFEGSSTTNPTLTIRRWVTKTSDSCEISNDSPPCWGTAMDVTAAGFAEAKVNTESTALDTVAPTQDTLGLNEFGEAGIDLTGAGIFGTSCTAFGQMEAVSRSSGNSGQAAMEDLVGPGKVEVDNCLPATITSQQKVSISDIATPTAFGTPTGTVDFKLFNTSDCSGAALYDSGLVPISSSTGKASTDNAPNGKPPTLKDDGTYYWLVTYSGDANNESSTKCGVEQTTITGNTPGIDP